LSFAPTLNAILNATSAVLLACGYAMIRRRRISAHRACMLAAFACSTVFLVSYVLYHLRVGVVHFTGQGWIRPVYFTLLGTHTVLAIAIVPLALITLSRALSARYDRHRRIARWTLPLWFYVSVTGVIIYFLLYHLYAPLGA
jgi:putative membrane protein